RRHTRSKRDWSSDVCSSDLDHNVALADTPGETDIDNMLFVQLPSPFRADFGLNSNPGNLDKQITVTGDLEEYHLHNGLKDPTERSEERRVGKECRTRGEQSA